jgi:hypothetical protein
MIWAFIKSLASGPVWQFFSRVDWRVWAAVGLLAAFQVHGCTQYRKGYNAGETAVLDRLREAEAKAVTRSINAARKADEVGAIEAERTAQIIAGQITRIEQAEREGTSPLDGLLWGK